MFFSTELRLALFRLIHILLLPKRGLLLPLIESDSIIQIIDGKYMSRAFLEYFKFRSNLKESCKCQDKSLRLDSLGQ